MAKLQNPRKKFKYRVTIPGLNPLEVQTLKMPDIDFEQVEHGENGRTIKTAGMEKVGTLTLEKLASADVPNTFFWNWRDLIKLGNANAYKKPIMVEETGPDGFSVINTHILVDCWPTKINGIELAALASENTIESIEFSVDDIEHD